MRDWKRQLAPRGGIGRSSKSVIEQSSLVEINTEIQTVVIAEHLLCGGGCVGQ